MVDPTGVTSWNYDEASRITEVAAPQGTVSYTYDEVGRRESMTQPEGVVSYGYDGAGRLSTLTDWLGNTTTLGYTVDSTLDAITRSNGVSTSFGYDAALRVDEIVHTGPAGLIDSFDYTLDEAGNRVGVVSGAGAEAYTLDELGRLTQVTYPDGQTVAYTYDDAGNRLSETVDGTTTDYTYDAAGRLTSDGVNSYSYDAAGNTTVVGSDTYSWDWANRLTEATVAGESVAYEYDGASTRVSATDSAGSADFVWDRASLLPMLVSDGTSGYVHLGRQPNETVTGTDVSFDLTDALGSVRATTDATGAVTGTASYDVYGAPRDVTGTLGAFGFTGEQSDPTGLLYLRARYYNPQVGRFLSADALQPNAFGTQGWNQYGYVAGNPTTMVDPTGHAQLVEYSLKTSLIGGAISGTIGFGISIFTCRANQAGGEYNGSYAGCVFRGTMAAVLAGVISSGLGPAWGFWGSAFAGGVIDSAIFQGIETIFGNGEFSLTQLVIDGLIGLAGAGVARGLGSLFQRFKPTWLDDLFRRTDVTPGTGAFCSFSGDTEVLMADGTSRPISEIEVGDMVLSADPVTGEQRGEEVLAVFVHDDVTVDFATSAGIVTTTEDHRFYNVSDSEWQQSQDLDQGDALYSADGSVVTAIGLEWHTAEYQQVYNLDVDDLDSYYVVIGDDAVLVHNDDGLTAYEARREAMRLAGIPTSQQPIQIIDTVSGPQYIYEVPAPGGGTMQMGVQLSTTDAVPGHGPHWEAGPLKGREQVDPLGRYRLTNDKVKVDIGVHC